MRKEVDILDFEKRGDEGVLFEAQLNNEVWRFELRLGLGTKRVKGFPFVKPLLRVQAKKGDKAWEAEEMAFDTPIFRKFEWRPRYHAWLFAANFAEWLETCEDVTAALQKAIQSWGECNTLELKYT